MLNLISDKIYKVAYEVIAADSPELTVEDVKLLRKKGPNLLKDVQKKAKEDKKHLENLCDKDKRILLAYLVYFRQNITTESTDNPNQEDAAKILHKEIFKEDDKETSEKIVKQIKKQLSKIGISIKD